MLELGFELAVTPTAILDGTGHYLRVNDAFGSLFGHPKEWFAGRSFFELTHPAERTRDASFIQNLGDGTAGKAVVKKRYVREDGSVIFASTSVAVLDRVAGAVSMLMAEVTDLTELHDTMEALQTSEQRLAMAMEASNDGLWDWDFLSGELVVNSRWWSMFGFAPNELPATIRTWQSLAHPDDIPRAYAQLEAHARGELPQVELEMRMRRKDGAWMWILNRAKIVALSADGTPRRVVGTHSDITARREQDEARHRQTAVLNTVLSSIPIAIDIIDPSGRIEYINAYCEQLLGWSIEEMHETDVMAKLYPDPLYRAKVLESMTSGSPAWRDWDMVARDGRRLTVSWANVRLEDGRTIGMGTDVTAIRAAETAEEHLAKQIQQAQKLESLGLLAGGIAHDFNNLLVGVLGNASLAQDVLPPGSEASQLVAEIRTAATRAADLTRQLLAYAGKGRFVVEPVDVGSIVGEMASLLRSAVRKDVTLRQNLETGLPAVNADATQVRQVVMNLITNASDAMGTEGGAITLTARSCQPSDTERQSVVGGTPLSARRYVCIEVADTGSGMNDTTLSRIFDPFFTTKTTGHGLGLAATLGIMRSHSGGIAVSSVAGKGTHIRLYLPALDRSVTPNPAAITGAVHALRSTGEILLADDEPAVRTVAARTLQRVGFVVTMCENGAEAVKLFSENPSRWTAIVLDLTMPVLNGQDALLAIRAIRPDVPAVLCSGYASEELDERITSLERVGFVQKPFTVSGLTGAVFELLPPDEAA